MESLPVNKIFILTPKNSMDEISIKKLDPLPAFKQMEKQAYKYQLIVNTKLRGVHFSLLSQLISQIPVFAVSRPMIGTNIEQLSEALENLF